MNIKSSTLPTALLAALLAHAGLANAQTTTGTTPGATTGTTTGTTSGTTLEAQASSIQNFSRELARADLAAKGNTTPTQTELDAAAKTIQDKRASGMGWGQIANSLGLRLGEVVSAARRSENASGRRGTDDTAADDKGKNSRQDDAVSKSARADDSGSRGSNSGHGGGKGGGGGGGGGGRGK